MCVHAQFFCDKNGQQGACTEAKDPRKCLQAQFLLLCKSRRFGFRLSCDCERSHNRTERTSRVCLQRRGFAGSTHANCVARRFSNFNFEMWTLASPFCRPFGFALFGLSASPFWRMFCLIFQKAKNLQNSIHNVNRPPARRRRRRKVPQSFVELFCFAECVSCSALCSAYAEQNRDERQHTSSRRYAKDSCIPSSTCNLYNCFL